MKYIVILLFSMLLTMGNGKFPSNAVAASDLNSHAGKFALLIGNQDYDGDGKYTPPDKSPPNRLKDLRNPCNDVILIESRLLELGWLQENIITLCNVTRGDILNNLQIFALNYMSKEGSAFGFIYYTGHGVQVNEDTYVFGINANIDIGIAIDRYKNFRQANLFDGAIRLHDEVIDEVGDPGRGSILIVIDACRENPIHDKMYIEGKTVTVSAPVPMASKFVYPGMQFLYSTAAGALASDGTGNNNPFATIFARNMPAYPLVDHLVRSVVSDLYFEKIDPHLRVRLFTNKVQMPDVRGTLQKPPPDVCFGECG